MRKNIKKTMTSVLLVFTILCALVPCVHGASGTKYGDLYYDVNKDNTAVTITGCDSAATEIVMPSEIEGLPVTSIGSMAFYECTKLTDITLPDSVTNIKFSAFALCKNLTNIIIPNGVTKIGQSAFSGCSSLTDIAIPNGVTKIENWTFSECSKLTNLSIPNSVAEIGSDAFSYCKSLTDILIPNGVRVIGSSAFQSCTSLTNIILPETLTEINAYAFEYTAYYNDSANWENGVLYIDKCLIVANKDLPDNYIIKDGTTVIGSDAFFCRDNLKSITIPNSVTELSGSDFYWCSNLTNVALPDSLKSIGPTTFYGCTSLTDITLPKNVVNIGREALKNTGYYNDDSNWENGVLYIDKFLIAGKNEILPSNCIIKDGITSICDGAFSDCLNLESIKIPNGVTTIGDGAFEYCSSLTSVAIPDSVTTISDNVFGYCSSLTSVAIPDSITSIGDWTFNGCDNLTDIYYTGSEEQWKAISIGDYNECLTNATIHYNYIKTTPDTYAIGEITPTDNGVAFTVTANETVSGQQAVIVACYDENGVFISLTAQEITASNEPQNISVEIDKSNAKTIKAFIWNAMDYMMPASRATSFEL